MLTEHLHQQLLQQQPTAASVLLLRRDGHI